MGLSQLIRRVMEHIVPSDVSNRNKGTFNLPSAGVMLATTTGAAAWGVWAELITALLNTEDRWVTKLTMRGDEVLDVSSFQLGIGAAGSEVPLITSIISVLTAEDSIVVTFAHPVKIASGTRIAGRCWSDTDGGTVDFKIAGRTGLGVSA